MKTSEYYLIKKIRQVYNNLICTIPYSSIAPIYNVAGDYSPIKYGKNCNGLAVEARQNIEVLGVDNIYYLRDHRHHAVYFIIDNHQFLLDPYLLHSNPIVLTVNDKKQYHAYPEVEGHSAYLEVDFTGEIIKLVKARFDFLKRKYEKSYFSFRLADLLDRTPDPSDSSIAFDPEQTTLSIRVLENETKHVMHLVYPVYLHRGCTPSKNNIYIKNNNGLKLLYSESREFKAAISSIASATNSTVNELLDYVLTGVELYERLAPRNIIYSFPNPVNQ